ncbi:MAG: hypothetical protein IT384_06310 [Deltaproteobacteria bacterium]|nr:hypothetical protein [Deltaproteobacteria bacterium]
MVTGLRDATRRGLLIAVAIVVAPLVARAEPEPHRFSWVRGPGAEDCAGAEVLSSSVSARLGQSPFSSTAPRVIEGMAMAREHGFVAHILVRARDGSLLGSRVLESDAERCASLDAAVVLAIVLLIDPEETARTRPPLAARAPTAPPPPAAPVPAPIAPSDHGVAALRALVSGGLLPGPSIGLGASLSGAIGARWAWTVDVRFHPELRSLDSGDFAFGLTAAGPGACARFGPLAWLETEGCASLLAGALHAVVFRPAPTAPGERLWLAAGAAVRARAHVLPALSIELGGELLVPLVRHRFFVEGRDSTVFQQGSVLPGASLGLAVHFR